MIWYEGEGMNRGTIYIGLAIVTTAADTAFAAGAVRSLPQHVQGGTAFDVVITIDPPTGTTALGIEESPPSGWSAIADISNGGTYDAGSHKVKWGPFFAPSFPTQVSYTITPPPAAQGNQCFVGLASFNGFNEPIQGLSCVQVTPGIPAVSEWGLLILSLSLLTVGTLVVAPRHRVSPLPLRGEWVAP